MDLWHVLKRHVDIVILELEAYGWNQGGRLILEPVHELDDLLPYAIVARLGLVLSNRRKVSGNSLTSYRKRLTLCLGFKP